MKFNNLCCLILITFSFTFQSYLISVPHISGKHIKGQPRDHVNINFNELKHKKIGSTKTEIFKAPNVLGEKKIAVIIVDFADKNMDSDWWSQANITFSQLKNYYSEVSHNKISLSITYFYNGGSTTGSLNSSITPYTLTNNMGYYAKNENTLIQLVKDAINKTPSQVNGSDYNYVMVLHAGYGQETTSDTNDIWSVFVSWSDAAVRSFNDGTIVPEKEKNASPVGVVCHEFGHQLGLPDIYYPGPTEQISIVGKWCLMDYGCWAGSPQGSTPVHLSAWCKYYLGWTNTVTISSNITNINLMNVFNSNEILKIPVFTADDPSKEFFLLECRKRIGFDTYLPNDGLLIWRIDDSIASDPNRLLQNNINSGIPHLAVDLIEADKTPSGINRGDTGDPFPGSQNKVMFIPEDYNLSAFNSQYIPLCISNISFVNTYSLFNILFNLDLVSLDKNKFIISNNYTTAGSPMNIGFNLSQPQNIKIYVYDIAGNLVKEFQEKSYPEGQSQETWYGTDDLGNKLTPGLYFICFKYDNNVKVEKFIIKRKL